MTEIESHPQEAPRKRKRGASSFVDDSQHSKEFYIKFGEFIRAIREKSNITQSELSTIVSINRSYLSEIESGRRKVSLFIAYKIAKSLGVSIDEFLGDKK